MERQGLNVRSQDKPKIISTFSEEKENDASSDGLVRSLEWLGVHSKWVDGQTLPRGETLLCSQQAGGCAVDTWRRERGGGSFWPNQGPMQRCCPSLSHSHKWALSQSLGCPVGPRFWLIYTNNVSYRLSTSFICDSSSPSLTSTPTPLPRIISAIFCRVESAPMFLAWNSEKKSCVLIFKFNCLFIYIYIFVFFGIIKGFY